MAKEETVRGPGPVTRRLFRRRAARAEGYILDKDLPDHIDREVRRKHPHLSSTDLALVDRGLREWFICCAYRRRKVLGMPSRAVDDAWHAFILDSAAYMAFCNAAFGAYLHHTPEGEMDQPMPGALDDTIRAWDRSLASSDDESVLWDLDGHLGIEDPLGISDSRLAAVRSGAGGDGGSAGACGGWTSNDGGSGEIDGGGSDGGGGGCGGGGCGGGGS